MENEKKKVSKWLVLILLTAAFMGSFAARMIWSPFIASASTELGIQAAQAGLFVSMFYIGYMITQLPGGILADRFGVKYVLSISVLITGVFTLLVAYIDSYTVGLIFRLLAGLGSGTIVACSSRVIASSFEPQKRGTPMGIFFSASMAGLLLANTIAPIALSLGTWRIGFTWLGIGLMLLAVLLFVILEKQPKKEITETVFGGLATVFKSKNILIMAFVGFTYIWLVLAFATWANRYMASIGIEPATASGIMRWYSLSAMIAVFIGGWVVDALKINRVYFVASLFVCMIIATFIFAAQSTVMGLTIAAIVYGFVSYLPNSNLTSLVVDYAGVEHAGTAVGGANFTWQLGAVLSPVIAGAMFQSTGNFSSVWLLLAALPVLGTIGLLFLNKKVKIVSELSK
ncbi:MAG: MFS transporter [Eubacteriaceae bacterium]|nr:MFS transporter [Eubacteriaceae bacterium]